MRETPYSSFNFVVNLGGRDQNSPLGGFSDCSGLGTEFTMAEYRNGNEKTNHVRKVPGLHKNSDVTLKRGVVNSEDLWEWINAVRQNGYPERRDVVITMRDEAGTDIQQWQLHSVFPMKWTGPTFAAKGGGDVAMEELVLTTEGMDFEQLG